MKLQDVGIAAITVKFIEQLDQQMVNREYTNIHKYVDDDLLQYAAEKQIARYRDKLKDYGVEFPKVEAA